MTIRLFFLVAFFTILWLGCDTAGDDDPGAVVDAVFVVNQGNFSDANGSVTVLDSGVNPSRRGIITGLGSILQSAAVIDGKLYLMSNSAERIDVFDATSLEQIGQISDVISPRYLIADRTSAYVTSLYGASGGLAGGNVTVVDVASDEKGREIPVGDNPEGMAMVAGRLYVANHGFGAGRTLSVIDLESQAVIDTVDVECDGPRFLLADGDDEIFVFCTGQTFLDEEFNVIGETDGAVRVLNGTTGELLERIDIAGRIGTEGPGQDAYFAKQSGRMYAVKDQSTVLVFDTGSNELIDEVGPFDGDAIGAVAYDEQRDLLYLARTAGFVESGTVTIHTDDGDQVGIATVGVAPAYIIIPRN